MRKLLIASLATIAVLIATSTSHAQHRQGGYYGGGYRGYNGGYRGYYGNGYRGYAYGNRGYNYAPWVAGAVGLGILGAAAAGTYYYNNPVCYDRVVGYDAWNQLVVRRFCQ